MIVGVGVDVVDVERFKWMVRRTPGVLEKLFTEEERKGISAESLAARFAAKEAIAKALGVPRGMEWHDCAVVSDENGRPTVTTRGTIQAAADAQHITSWHISLSHDGGVAMAYVVAESSDPQ